MRRVAITFMALMVVAIGITFAEGKDRRKTITFANDVTVNGTLVKQGTYDVRFDSETNEVMILKEGRMVATTRVEVQPTEKANAYNAAGFVEEPGGRILKTLSFRGDKRVLLVGPSSSQSAGTE